MAEHETEQAPAKKGGKFKKLIILFVAAIVVLGGAGAGVYFFMPQLIPGKGKAAEGQAEGHAAEKTAEHKPAVEAGPPSLGALFPLESFIVNLADPGGKRYLKVNMTMELSNAELKKEIEGRLPQIRDAILLLLSSLTFDDINSMEGKIRLRSQIVSRCNSFLKSGAIANVFFSEFVVQ